jgi:hypothetical protein
MSQPHLHILNNLVTEESGALGGLPVSYIKPECNNFTDDTVAYVFTGTKAKGSSMSKLVNTENLKRRDCRSIYGNFESQANMCGTEQPADLAQVIGLLKKQAELTTSAFMRSTSGKSVVGRSRNEEAASDCVIRDHQGRRHLPLHFEEPAAKQGLCMAVQNKGTLIPANYFELIILETVERSSTTAQQCLSQRLAQCFVTGRFGSTY